MSIGAGPTRRLGTWAATRAAWFRGLDLNDGVMGALRGHDVVRFRAGARRYVAFAHPDLVDHVLYEGRENYVKSIEYETLRAVFGLALITDDGDSWSAHRAMLNPMFARRHLNELVDLMIEPIETLADRLELQADRGSLNIDMTKAMVDVTLDVVGNAMFSQDFSTINERMCDVVTAGLRRAENTVRVLLVLGQSRRRARLVVTVIRSRIPLPSRALREMRNVLRTTDAAIDKVVADRVAHPTDNPDLLNLLLAAGDNGESLPMERVRGEALQFMLAGHETTANAMSWMWYLLAINPAARDRMHVEVDDVLGGAPPTIECLARLPWTTACVEEAMRMYPPVPILPRLAIRDDVVSGHHVRRGTTVLLPVHQIHHDPRFWDNPETFDPSRFLPHAGGDRPRSAYLPFGGGRRLCIGRSFALIEMVLLTASLSQRFIFDLSPGHPVDPEATLTLRPRHGLKMIAYLRAEVTA
jgi:cytochrome P450